jgi:hypothetical protein
MTYDPKQHHRRSIRLVSHDYAEAGMYFVTVCTDGHKCLFGCVVGDAMQLNDTGHAAAWHVSDRRIDHAGVQDRRHEMDA